MTVNNINNGVTPAALVDILSKLMGILSLNEAKFGVVLNSMNSATSSLADVMEKNQKELSNITDSLDSLTTWTNEIVVPATIMSGLVTASMLAEGKTAAGAGMSIGASYILPSAVQSATSLVSAGMTASQADKTYQIQVEKSIIDQQSKENDRLADTITGTESTKGTQADALNDIINSVVQNSKLRI